MIRSKFLILLFVVLCESRKSLVPQAISELVQSNYGESLTKIEVIYNSKRIKILGETLKLLSAVREVKVTNLGSPFGHHNQAIMLFDTFQSYLNFAIQILFGKAEHRSEVDLLIFCEDLTKEKLRSNITSLTFESFLVAENNEISLETMNMFTEHQCNAPQLLEINNFSNSRKKWTTDKFFAPRIENFHGCEIKIAMIPDNFPYAYWRIQEDGKKVVDGVLIKMVQLLSAHLNFKPVYSTNESPRDLKLGVDIVELQMFNRSCFSDPIHSTSDVFVVPPGEPYKAWEKLLMPFDGQTWMWLGITFAIAFLVIIWIKLTRSTSMYELVVGSNVSTPTLNVVGIFMGIGQLLLPQRNISRFLFTNFLLFCLIMRTAYQGKYFEFITSNMNKKQIASVDELREKNFTVYVDFDEFIYEEKYAEFEILEG